MLDSRRGRPKGLSGLMVLGSAFVGLWLAVLSAPVLAQSWPSESGPNGDVLGFTLRQFDRMDPPPVEAGPRAERVVPNMPRADLLPSGTIDVGMPVITRSALPDRGRSRGGRSVRAPGLRRQDMRRSEPGMTHVARRPRGRGQNLARELADRDRQIWELRRQIEDDRRGAQQSSGIGSAFSGISPAAAAVPPR